MAGELVHMVVFDWLAILKQLLEKQSRTDMFDLRVKMMALM